MKILLIGRTGQVGWELARTLAPLGEVIAPARATLDLAKPDTITQTVRAVKPHIIVNAAAYTAVDRAESEPDVAFAVNAVGPEVLAQESKRCGAFLLHYSTDYVFDGQNQAAYTEDDGPNPLNVYGKTKLEGERAIQAVGGRALVLRTSWVYGLRGQNFLLAIRRRAAEGALRVVCDQVGSPTWCRNVAEATAIASGRAEAVEGIFNLTCAGSTSWYGFATKIIAGSKINTHIEPVTSDKYVSAARRPANSRLDNGKFAREFGFQLPHWEESLKLCLAERNP